MRHGYGSRGFAASLALVAGTHHKHGVGGGTGGGTVVTGASTVALEVRALNGAAGTLLSDNGVPLPQGALFPSELNQVRLVMAGADVPVFVRAMGRHSDGSVRAIILQFLVTLPDANPLAATLLLRQGLRNTSTDRAEIARDNAPATGNAVGPNLPTMAVLLDPRKAGQPDAAVFPTSVAYLTSTNLCDEVEDANVTRGRSTPAALWESRWDASVQYQTSKSYSWDRSPWQATVANNVGALSEINVANANFLGVDLTSPAGPAQNATSGEVAPGYYNWRNQFAVGAAGTNYYDTALVCFARWIATADYKWWQWGCAYAWTYQHWARWIVAFAGGTSYIVQPNGVQPHQALPEGVAIHYLLTNDRLTREATVQSSAISWWNTWYAAGAGAWWTGLGDKNSYASEPRPMGRIVLTARWAWRAGDDAEQTIMAPFVATAIGKILTGTGNYGDGTFRCNRIQMNGSVPYDDRWFVPLGNVTATTLYWSNFMHMVLGDSWEKSAKDLPNQPITNMPGTPTLKTAVYSAIKQILDRLYPHDHDGELRGYDVPFPNFEQAFQGPYVAHPWPQSGDLTAMYAAVFADYAAYSGDVNAAIYMAKADRIMLWAIGNGPMSGSGNGPDLLSQKTKSENYFNSFRYWGIKGRTSVTAGAIPEPAVSLNVSPTTLLMDPGSSSAPLAVAATTWNGLPTTSVPTVTFASTVPIVATVGASTGVVVANSVGNATITVSSAGLTGAAVAVTVATAIFLDNFAGSTVDATKWTQTITPGSGSASIVVAGGAVTLTATGQSAAAGLTSVPFDLSTIGPASEVLFAQPLVLGAPGEVNVFVQDAAGNGVRFRLNLSTNLSYTFKRIAGVETQQSGASAITDPNAYKYLRITRNAAGTTFTVSFSADTGPGTVHTATLPVGSMDVAHAILSIFVNHTLTGNVALTAVVDRVRVL